MVDVHHFQLNNSFPYVNILRKWNKFCIAFDFEKNEGQTAFNGRVSRLIRNPDSGPNMKGSFDARLISEAEPGTPMTLIIGRYAFDKNPMIGTMAGVNVWDRAMTESELLELTRCDSVGLMTGNVIGPFSSWNLEGAVVKAVRVKTDQLRCHRFTEKVNVFLPIPELTNRDAIELCHKFGENVPIAGNFEDKEGFDAYYEGVLENERFVYKCGFYDNGRLKTWLPYRHNTERTALVHQQTGLALLAGQTDKYYVEWYGGPETNDKEDQCGATYMGIVPRYQNIQEDSCLNKKCTACEIPNSFHSTSSLTLRGLCKYSFLDTTYQVTYDPQNTVSYIGIERSVISFNSEKNVWIITDISNPNVSAVSTASYRSLGNIFFLLCPPQKKIQQSSF